MCESFKPEIDDIVVSTLRRVRPTLVLAPVLSKPTERSIWERPASQPWGDQGAEMVIANSLVVAEWLAAAEGVAFGDAVGCGAARPLVAGDAGHKWVQLVVEPRLAGGVTDSVVSVR